MLRPPRTTRRLNRSVLFPQREGGPLPSFLPPTVTASPTPSVSAVPRTATSPPSPVKKRTPRPGESPRPFEDIYLWKEPFSFSPPSTASPSPSLDSGVKDKQSAEGSDDSKADDQTGGPGALLLPWSESNNLETTPQTEFQATKNYVCFYNTLSVALRIDIRRQKDWQHYSLPPTSGIRFDSDFSNMSVRVCPLTPYKKPLPREYWTVYPRRLPHRDSPPPTYELFINRRLNGEIDLRGKTVTVPVRP
jgi:hypothetical protein